jgi:hypothetical protein
MDLRIEVIELHSKFQSDIRIRPRLMRPNVLLSLGGITHVLGGCPNCCEETVSSRTDLPSALSGNNGSRNDKAVAVAPFNVSCTVSGLRSTWLPVVWSYD